MTFFALPARFTTILLYVSVVGAVVVVMLVLFVVFVASYPLQIRDFFARANPVVLGAFRCDFSHRQSVLLLLLYAARSKLKTLEGRSSDCQCRRDLAVAVRTRTTPL